MRPNWRVYFADGRTFDSLRWEPHELPATGFICACQYTNGDRQIMHGWDHYWFNRDDNLWWGQDREGIFDTLEQRIFPYAYIRGRMVGDQLYKELMYRAHKDPDFPIKEPRE